MNDESRSNAIVRSLLRIGGALIFVGTLAVIGVGCAAGEVPGGADGGDGGGMDGRVDLSDGGSADAEVLDAGDLDAGGGDGGPEVIARTCEACEEHSDCATGSFCVSLSVGGKACVPSCVPDIPTCPRSFSCVLDVASGVDTTVCLPVGGTCCVDEDADEHGQGVGCMGTDCDDLDPDINPAADEVCDGVDQDCDGTADDPPTDCVSGRCTAVGDGTYTAVTGADCMDAMCASGTTTDCMLFTCEDGAEAGNRCATDCAPAGTDDHTLCIDSAHCDAGACVPDIPNGMACIEDTDCTSAHCENGFCCGTGTCCSETADCPGGGGVTTLCDDATTCQGTRGETTCNSEFRCQTMSGIEDDSACDTSTEALSCAPYDPVFCTGGADQTAPGCPTSCSADADCIDTAHCDSGYCIPDRPPGASCTRNQNCQAGLTCTDGVCCTSACTGSCQACNLTGSLGSCVNIPSGSDPSGECPGFSCMAFYDGFGAGENSCYFRQNVSDATATCNGGGSCLDPATACSTQPRGSVQISCNATCQTPTAGTCTGMTPGACTNLDDPSITTTCGVGACARTVQRCTGGSPTTCTPGTPVAESCNGIDDDCNGTVDNGSASVLCPPPMTGVATACDTGVCRLASCPTGFHDVDGSYSNGCECEDDAAGNTCSASLSIGTLSTAGSSLTYDGTLIPGQTDWVTVSFPTPRGASGGAPSIAITHSGGGANPFRMAVFSSCAGVPGSPMSNCNTAGDAADASAVTSWSFRDNATSGATAYSSHSITWPSSVIVRITRSSAATTCAQAQYSLTVSR